MNQSELISQFHNLKTYNKDGRHAPHKPLLLLLALGRLQQNKPRLMPFDEIEESLNELLTTYGNLGKARPEYPFWHLRTALFWEVPNEQTIPTQSGSASRKHLRDNKIQAGFTQEAFELISADPQLLRELALSILRDHFSDTPHPDILEKAGIDF